MLLRFSSASFSIGVKHLLLIGIQVLPAVAVELSFNYLSSWFVIQFDFLVLCTCPLFIFLNIGFAIVVELF